MNSYPNDVATYGLQKGYVVCYAFTRITFLLYLVNKRECSVNIRQSLEHYSYLRTSTFDIIKKLEYTNDI